MDNLATNEFNFSGARVGETKIVSEIIPGWQGVDIGPETRKLFQNEIVTAKTILWNGPMGVFEIDACFKGTFAIAKAVAKSGAVSIICGGDSIKSLKKSGYEDQVTFISTGGGASLEFLEGKTLPGVHCLERHS